MSNTINNAPVTLDTTTPVGQSSTSSSVSMEDALQSLQLDKLNATDAQLQGQIDTLQDNNTYVKNLSTVVNILKSTESQADANGQVTLKQIEATFLSSNPDLYAGISSGKSAASPKDFRYWLEAVGLSPGLLADSSQQTSKVDVSQMVAQGKTLIDNANSNNQMQMIRMQSLSNTRSEIFNMVSNTMKKMDDTTLSVIRNIS